MPATSAITGKGAKFGYAANEAGLSAPTYLAEVTDIKVPEQTVARIEATNYESPSDAMEYISAVWKDAGEFQVELTYVAAQSLTVNGLLGDTVFFKILLPNAAYWTFKGHVSKLGTELPNKDKIKQTVTIAPHGLITVA